MLWVNYNIFYIIFSDQNLNIEKFPMILTNNNMALYRNPQNLNNLKPDFQIILNGQKYDVERKKLIKGSLYFAKICETGVDSATIT